MFPHLLILSLAASVNAYAHRPPIVNPTFDLTERAAREALAREAQAPARLDRPLVILGGFLDVGVGPAIYETRLKRYVRGRIICITFADCTSLAQCRQRVTETLDRELGKVDATRTAQVDVIGQSLGGLIAMY